MENEHRAPDTPLPHPTPSHNTLACVRTQNTHGACPGPTHRKGRLVMCRAGLGWEMD